MQHILLLLEAAFVGLYCLVVYVLLSPQKYMWFLFGFVKHFTGYVIGLHNYYCKYGYACKADSNKHASSKYLVLDSIVEGLLF